MNRIYDEIMIFTGTRNMSFKNFYNSSMKITLPSLLNDRENINL